MGARERSRFMTAWCLYSWSRPIDNVNTGAPMNAFLYLPWCKLIPHTRDASESLRTKFFYLLCELSTWENVFVAGYFLRWIS